jgi:hypothetical protein
MAGGRCTLCNLYLLEGKLTYTEVPLGEGAHIVGQKDTQKSPRGLDPLPKDQRDLASNLMLACSGCHNEIDQLLVAGLLDADFLRSRKTEHENTIRHQTGLVRSARTVILRVSGYIRGGAMELARDNAVEAVIKSAGRWPLLLDSFDQQAVEIDLRDIDGETDATQTYYAAATAKVDSALANRVHPGMRANDISHLSVFAIARIPLLVHLGAKLDDGIPTDIYQRHRHTDSWIWQTEDAGTTFRNTEVRAGAADLTNAALITNLSGTTPLSDLPRDLDNAAVFVINPDRPAAEDLFASREVLARFDAVVRDFFTRLESTHKQVARIHLFGALPLSAAVTFGRVLKSTGLRPTVVTYDYTKGAGYTRALEV